MVFQKSLTRELTLTALGVFIVLLAIIVSTQAINLLGRAAEGQIANEAVAALIGFWTLGFFPVLMILTVFVSVLVVFTRAWRDHEMVVWLSSGLSLRDWIWPIMRFTLPLAVLVAGVTLFVGPWADQRSQDYAEIIKRREEISAISPGVFKESASSSKVYFIENYSGLHSAATNIFMQDMTEGKVSTIFAKRGYISIKPDGERVLVLEDGKRYVGEPGQADYQIGEFKRYTASLGDSQVATGPASNRQSIPTRALIAGSGNPEYRAELAWRLSMPFSCIFLALLALPLSYYNPRSGHTYNLLFALLAFFLYQNGLTLTRNWVGQDKVGVWAVALVHALMLAAALLLLKHRDRPQAPFSQSMRLMFSKKR
ncbi:LPS export ABC transporter permease LptF [Chromobacterium phragmitis]|uniref:Lipopolysaccharide export system permease protein LptF n=1 Tax=Chromobacterium phragmitis TaxID=2202141 RepID=A0A344UEB8_9NEIS|nr:LPS export ABC transporter permease LptF [Chromobacterium phragmitis]AXE32276.1 LPS export ABC transporter permease LptF [Chromobacterium phragmitis]AXE33616.1 LPS export ABC transporter permease LptF [Chromobacterium phragmitis]